MLDGVEIKTLNLKWLRKQMGLVGPDPDPSSPNPNPNPSPNPNPNPSPNQVAGSVLLDGVEIKSLNLKWLRKQMGLVGPDP